MNYHSFHFSIGGGEGGGLMVKIVDDIKTLLKLMSSEDENTFNLQFLQSGKEKIYPKLEDTSCFVCFLEILFFIK